MTSFLEQLIPKEVNYMNKYPGFVDIPQHPNVSYKHSPLLSFHVLFLTEYAICQRP